MNISRSIDIDAPAEKIYKKLNDFNEWTPWSPWLIMEPGVKVTVAPDSKSYEWEGARVGSGNMKILEEKENEFIDYDLIFLKPWKSKARTAFHLEENGESTRVTWTMKSSLPFFMFFMRKMMEAFVGADYERGLGMLKAYVEEGSIPSKLEFKGKGEFEGCNYVGIKSDCSMDKIGPQMASDFGKIRDWINAQTDAPKGDPFTIYHKWDIVKGRLSYTACFPVKDHSNNAPEGWIKGNIPATSTYTLRHIGAYEHIGNAWSTLYTMHRNKEIRIKKKIHPFEFYRNNPADTPREELIADITFPIK